MNYNTANQSADQNLKNELSTADPQGWCFVDSYEKYSQQNYTAAKETHFTNTTRYVHKEHVFINDRKPK